MTLALLADRFALAVLMLGASVLLAGGLPERRARVAWIALIALGAAYDLALNLQPANFPQSNFVHYYLGAKYPVPYAETYRLVHAGQGRPQIGMRDLERPAELVRSTPSEQRAYIIDLLRAARSPFDPLAPLDTLATEARETGAVEAEAERILSAHLPRARIADYRRDTRTMGMMGQGSHLTLDYGYNGSPFYGLMRQMDPTLHAPFGRGSALIGLLGQLLGVALIALLSGPALGLSMVERLMVAGLILVSSEFAEFAMPGLVFTELWVPLLLAAWALRRSRWALAGVAIAVAGLLKLFPFLLVTAAAVPLVRSFVRGASQPATVSSRRRAAALLASCATATLGLGLLAPLSGRTWTDFLHKIAVEFTTGSQMINSVSATALFATLGVPDRSLLPGLVSIAALLLLLLLFWDVPANRIDADVSRRSLVVVTAMGWLVKSWLSYYAVGVFLLLPLMARRHRAVAVTIAASMALSYMLPGFNDPALPLHPGLHALKLIPYLAGPACLVALEFQGPRWRARAVRTAAAASILLALATGEEIWRGSQIQRLEASGERALESGDAARALASYEQLARLSPGDARMERKRAIALAMNGRLSEALPGFARAVALDPEDAAAHDDYGRALLMSGRIDEAAREIELGHALAPTDVQILFQLAGVRASQGRRDEAVALLARAHELDPQEPAIEEALRHPAGR